MDREPVPMGLQVGPDPLSLALLALDGAGPGTRMTGRAFDGRRAFELSSACADAVEVLPETGEALLCTVEGKLLAGASRRWRDRGQPPEERPPARIWLGRDVVTDGWWPVRMEASTRWGTVIVRLVGPSPATEGGRRGRVPERGWWRRWCGLLPPPLPHPRAESAPRNRHPLAARPLQGERGPATGRLRSADHAPQLRPGRDSERCGAGYAGE